MSAADELTLPSDPKSVHAARAWIRASLDAIGRDDLIPGAQLCVSELVTNALLHGEPAIVVRRRGTATHPIIEVSDGSRLPPRSPLWQTGLENSAHPEDESSLRDGDVLTVGRGLGLVASYASAWGSDLDPDGHGKSVWFEPIAEPRDAIMGDIFDLAELAIDPGETLHVVDLLGVPVPQTAAMLSRFDELCRELSLLAVSDPERYPIAVRFTDLVTRVRADIRTAPGAATMSIALASDQPFADARVEMTAPAGERIARLIREMETIWEAFDDDTLLLNPFTGDERELQFWCYSQFVNQTRGGPAEPWPGFGNVRTEAP